MNRRQTERLRRPELTPPTQNNDTYRPPSLIDDLVSPTRNGEGAEDGRDSSVDNRVDPPPSTESVVPPPQETQNEEDELMAMTLLAEEAVEAEDARFAAEQTENLTMMMGMMGLERAWCLVALRRVHLDVESAVAFCFENMDSMPRISQTDRNDRVARYLQSHEAELRTTSRDRFRAAMTAASSPPPSTPSVNAPDTSPAVAAAAETEETATTSARSRSRTRSPPTVVPSTAADSIGEQPAVTSTDTVATTDTIMGEGGDNSTVVTSDSLVAEDAESSLVIQRREPGSESTLASMDDGASSDVPSSDPALLLDNADEPSELAESSNFVAEEINTSEIVDPAGDESESSSDDEEEEAALAMSLSLAQHDESGEELDDEEEDAEEDHPSEDGSHSGSDTGTEDEQECVDDGEEDEDGEEEDGGGGGGLFEDPDELFVQQNVPDDTPINTEALEEMISMGIPPEAAEFGLRTHDNVLGSAMAYIFDQGVDEVAAMAASLRNQPTRPRPSQSALQQQSSPPPPQNSSSSSSSSSTSSIPVTSDSTNRQAEIERMFAAAEAIEIQGNELSEVTPDAIDRPLNPLAAEYTPLTEPNDIMPPVPPDDEEVNPFILPLQPVVSPRLHDTSANDSAGGVDELLAPVADLNINITTPVSSSLASPTPPPVAPVEDTASSFTGEISPPQHYDSIHFTTRTRTTLETPVGSSPPVTASTTSPVSVPKRTSKKQVRLQNKIGAVDVMIMVNSRLYFSLLPACFGRSGKVKQVVVCERNSNVTLRSDRGNRDPLEELPKNTIFKLKKHPSSDIANISSKAKKSLSSSSSSGKKDKKLSYENESLYLIESCENDGVYLYASPDGTLQLTNDMNKDGTGFMIILYNQGKLVSFRTNDGRVLMIDPNTNKLKIDHIGDEYLNDLNHQNNEYINNHDIENGPWYYCLFNMMSRTTTEPWSFHRFTNTLPGKPFGLSNKYTQNDKFELTCSSYLGNSPQQSQLQHTGIWNASAGRVRFPLKGGNGNDEILDKTPGAWVAGSTNSEQFLCADLKYNQDLTGFAVQAPFGENMRVRKFNIEFSNDGKVWASLLSSSDSSTTTTTNGTNDNKMILPGNPNNLSVMIYKFSKPIRARYIKFIPLNWANAIALRIEFFIPFRYRFCMKENKHIDKSNLVVIPGEKIRFSFSTLDDEVKKAEDVSEIKASEDDENNKQVKTNDDKNSITNEKNNSLLKNIISMKMNKNKRKQYRFSITAFGLPFVEKERWLQGFMKQFPKINKSMNSWESGMDIDVMNWLQVKANDLSSSNQTIRCDSVNVNELIMTNRDRMQMQKLNTHNVPCWSAFPSFIPSEPSSEVEDIKNEVPVPSSSPTSSSSGGLSVSGGGEAAEEVEQVGGDKKDDDKEEVSTIVQKTYVEMDALSMKPMGSIRINILHIRIALLQCLNNRLRRILPFIDLGAGVDYFTGYKLRKLGYLIFYDLKMELLDVALRSSGTDRANPISMNLDHQKKTHSEDCGNNDPAVSQSIFAQAFHQSLRATPMQFRTNENAARVFSVNFVGEAGIDAGGVFRDAITEIVGDLHSPEHINLFMLCPNGIHKINSNMDKYIPNPKATSPLAIQMFEFVGKLMGVSLRTKATLPFNFPSLVWKGCVGSNIEVSDIENIDQVLTQTLRILVDPQLSESDFASSLPEDVCFTTTSSDGIGNEIELIPGGSYKKVNYHNRSEYSSLVIQFRIHEFDRQLAAIRRGLATVIPLHTLQLFTWQQVEELVAGKPEIDLDYLKKHTEYRGYSPTSKVVTYFWKTMETLTHVERSQFIRFVWGRSRLPLKGRSWPQSFKIQKCGGGDDLLPVSHTCFFSIELPDYSTEAICHKRLITAINYGAAGVLNS
jgi:hypothetical protein